MLSGAAPATGRKRAGQRLVKVEDGADPGLADRPARGARPLDRLGPCGQRRGRVRLELAQRPGMPCRDRPEGGAPGGELLVVEADQTSGLAPVATRAQGRQDGVLLGEVGERDLAGAHHQVGEDRWVADAEEEGAGPGEGGGAGGSHRVRLERDSRKRVAEAVERALCVTPEPRGHDARAVVPDQRLGGADGDLDRSAGDEAGVVLLGRRLAQRSSGRRGHGTGRLRQRGDERGEAVGGELGGDQRLDERGAPGVRGLADPGQRRPIGGGRDQVIATEVGDAASEDLGQRRANGTNMPVDDAPGVGSAERVPARERAQDQDRSALELDGPAAREPPHGRRGPATPLPPAENLGPADDLRDQPGGTAGRQKRSPQPGNVSWDRAFDDCKL